MRASLPSLTAMIVSASRGLALAPDEVLDPHAAALLPRPLGALLAAYRERPSPALHALLRRLSLGLVDHLALRTLAIDAALAHALAPAGPARQLVLLGAGLDARAHRLPQRAALRCFEVDHPSTQAWKRARAPALETDAAPVYVAVDFALDDLGERLAASGHRQDEASAWVWEGVTMYLAPEAVDATLSRVAARSAPGSTLIAS